MANAKVQVARRWIVMSETRLWHNSRPRNRRFFSLSELNVAIHERVVALNDRVTRHLGAIRRQLFEDLERPALRLDGMADVFAELQTREGVDDLTHADWLALLIDRELADRNTRRFRTRLCTVALRHAGAATEE